MNSYKFQDWLHQTWHPSEEDLLQYLDGELPAKETAAVRTHLNACWACRAQSDKMAQSILAFMDHRGAVLKDSMEALPNGQFRFEAQLNRLALEKKQPARASRLPNLPWLRIPMPASALRLAAGAALSLLAILVIIRLSLPPQVSAKELLERVERAESVRVSHVENPVVYQKMQVRRHSASAKGGEESLVWETWNDAGNRRFRQRVADRQGLRFISAQPTAAPFPGNSVDSAPLPPVLAELNQIFESNQLDFQRPLSPLNFGKWRDSLRQKSESVANTMLPGGGRGLTLTTSPRTPNRPGEIVQAKLTVRAADWHPVEANLRIQEMAGFSDYQLTETAFEVVVLNALPPLIFANTPANPTGIAGTLAPFQLSAPMASTAELREAEIEARFALHQARACLGEPIEVVRDTMGQVTVRGLVENTQRKKELLAALAPLPHVNAKIQTFEESEKLSLLPTSSSILSRKKRQEAELGSKALEVEVGRLPIQAQLERFFAENVSESEGGKTAADGEGASRKKIAELSNRALSLSEGVLAEAWALRRLAEQYPSGEYREMRSGGRQMLEGMINDHVKGLRVQLGRLREVLWPALSSVAGKNQESIEGNSSVPQPELSSQLTRKEVRWNPLCLEIFERVEPLCEKVRSLFAGTEAPNQDPKAAGRELLNLLQQSKSWFDGLETQLARDFPAHPNTSPREVQ